LWRSNFGHLKSARAASYTFGRPKLLHHPHPKSAKEPSKKISAGIIEGMLKMLYLLQSLIVEVMHAAAGWLDES
jgi:hypothetical protein